MVTSYENRTQELDGFVLFDVFLMFFSVLFEQWTVHCYPDVGDKNQHGMGNHHRHKNMILLYLVLVFSVHNSSSCCSSRFLEFSHLTIYNLHNVGVNIPARHGPAPSLHYTRGLARRGDGRQYRGADI